MNTGFKNRWEDFRSKFWLSLLFDTALIVTVFFSLHSWQTRHLPIDQAAPRTVLALLSGTAVQPVVREGQAGIVYFFAPWCIYCRHSIDNLQDLVDGGHVKWGTVVALDYGYESEVEEFVEQTGLTLPVLLGSARTASDWGVKGFPTYFVIDAEGRISSRSVGYSTSLGMLFRNWMALRR